MPITADRFLHRAVVLEAMRVSIAGALSTKFGKHPGSSALELLTEARLGALEDKRRVLVREREGERRPSSLTGRK